MSIHWYTSNILSMSIHDKGGYMYNVIMNPITQCYTYGYTKFVLIVLNVLSMSQLNLVQCPLVQTP